MESEIKIFKGSPIIGRKIKDIEEEFCIKVNRVLVHLPTHDGKNSDCFSANTYVDIEGEVEQLLKFTDYITEKGKRIVAK